ncbi:hypothetical protein CEXT_600031 [Caerostris extrusa]|uniref:Uncharacterized protein n=1 Tax=Caerostris extrusa TaxID=172846 RepID=A0AAV4RFR4_CAEEX|nr:hypothetical protein CEXT_600031 [Caerostris extrusa]
MPAPLAMKEQDPKHPPKSLCYDPSRETPYALHTRHASKMSRRYPSVARKDDPSSTGKDFREGIRREMIPAEGHQRQRIFYPEPGSEIFPKSET